jgi:hypothetical protein
MKFTSQICTTEEQSKRLLTLGIKKETADMMLVRNFGYLLEEPYRVTIWDPQTLSLHDNFQEFIDSMTRNLKGIDEQYVNDGYKPAWSLHRLLCLLPTEYIADIDFQQVMQDFVFRSQDMYDEVIGCIETLIKEGYFYEEYLSK